jgi:hypothetical protein
MTKEKTRVFNGQKNATAGGLKKGNLRQNKRGKVVSVVKANQNKQNTWILSKNISTNVLCGTGRFVAIKKGSELYELTQVVSNALKKGVFKAVRGNDGRVRCYRGAEEISYQVACDLAQQAGDGLDDDLSWDSMDVHLLGDKASSMKAVMKSVMKGMKVSNIGMKHDKPGKKPSMKSSPSVVSKMKKSNGSVMMSRMKSKNTDKKPVKGMKSSMKYAMKRMK